MATTATRLTEAYQEITDRLTREATPKLFHNIAPSMLKLEELVNKLNEQEYLQVLDDLNEGRILTASNEP
jgi:hypothetical protein